MAGRRSRCRSGKRGRASATRTRWPPTARGHAREQDHDPGEVRVPRGGSPQRGGARTSDVRVGRPCLAADRPAALPTTPFVFGAFLPYSYAVYLDWQRRYLADLQRRLAGDAGSAVERRSRGGSPSTATAKPVSRPSSSRGSISGGAASRSRRNVAVAVPSCRGRRVEGLRSQPAPGLWTARDTHAPVEANTLSAHKHRVALDGCTRSRAVGRRAPQAPMTPLTPHAGRLSPRAHYLRVRLPGPPVDVFVSRLRLHSVPRAARRQGG